MVKILLYAPGTTEGFHGMTSILDELQIDWHDYDGDPCLHLTTTTTTTTTSWLLLPMESRVDLQSSDLGYLLEHALNRVRGHLRQTNNSNCLAPIIFLGMDSPMLPLDDIVNALGITNGNEENDEDDDNLQLTRKAAILCPASDGGYGMLSVPGHADAAQTFQQILWSHPLTAIAQIKALSDQGIPVRIGTLMEDIDEPPDVEKLCQRLKHDQSGNALTTNSILDRPCGSLSSMETTRTTRIQSSHPTFFYTRHALSRAGLLS